LIFRIDCFNRRKRQMGIAESSLGIAGVIAIAWGATNILSTFWTAIVLIIGVVLVCIAVALVVGKLWMCERNHARFEAAYKTCSGAMGEAAKELARPVTGFLGREIQQPVPPPPESTTGAPPPSAGRFYFPGRRGGANMLDDSPISSFFGNESAIGMDMFSFI
jgi:hypothetical protein